MIASLPSRGLRGYAGGLLAGGISAASFAVAIMHPGMLFVVLACLSAIPLFFAGLGAGLPSVMVAIATALIGLAIAKPVNFVLFYIVLYGLPALVLVMMALRRQEDAEHKIKWYPEGDLLIAVALYPCLAFIAAMAATIQQGGLLALTIDGLVQGLAAYKDMVDADTYKEATEAAKIMAGVFPMIIGCSWMFVMLLSMYIAQVILQKQNWNLRPEFAIQKIRIPKWLFFVMLAMGLTGKYAPAPYDYAGMNLAFMLAVPLFFEGLAIVHAYAATTAYRGWILALFYILLSIPLTWTLIPTYAVTLLLGVADEWVDFRQRFAAKQQKQRR